MRGHPVYARSGCCRPDKPGLQPDEQLFSTCCLLAERDQQSIQPGCRAMARSQHGHVADTRLFWTSQAEAEDEEMEDRGGTQAERDQRAVKPGYESDEEPGTRHQQSHRTPTPQPGSAQPKQACTSLSMFHHSHLSRHLPVARADPQDTEPPARRRPKQVQCCNRPALQELNHSSSGSCMPSSQPCRGHASWEIWLSHQHVLLQTCNSCAGQP